MNANEYAARLHNRLLPKARTEAQVYDDFMKTLRGVVEDNRRDWERWHAEEVESVRRGQAENWGQTSINFHTKQAAEWERFAALANDLRVLNRENSDALLDRVIGALMGIDDEYPMLSLYFHIALNIAHLWDTPTGQYEDWQSPWSPLIMARWDQVYERNSERVDELMQIAEEQEREEIEKWKDKR